ncbi:MAG: phytanoyl-CoA dioxygenase family protein [Lentisphaerae bacterium]|nr:phytanoyl-CoA dioxygenase family protein [Lentisphaerota bacterium]
MKTTLTPAQIDAYREQGFVLQPGFLTADEVAELKAAVLGAVSTMGRKKVAGGGKNLEEGDTYYDRVFTQRLNLWRINDTVKRYMLGPELGRMLCTLSGCKGYRVWHDQTLIKEPYGNATGWHLDNPYWSFDSREAISIWIALEDATYQNGCMWFVPGSHKLAHFENASLTQPNMGELFKTYPAMTQVDPVGAPMKAGDCSFHNGLTAHGAGANMTRQRRIAMTCAYMPVGSTFNGKPNILPEEYLASLKLGDELANNDWNPVVFATP